MECDSWQTNPPAGIVPDDFRAPSQSHFVVIDYLKDFTIFKIKLEPLFRGSLLYPKKELRCL